MIELLAGAPELRDLALPKAFFDRMGRFAAALSRWGSKTNLTASPQSSQEIGFHIIDSLAPLWAFGGAPEHERARFGTGCQAADIGSGAGFPGLVLAAATPAHFTLVEARRKRASFLKVASAEMELENVAVRWNRAQLNQAAERYDIVTSRAVRVSRETLDFIAAALRPGGRALLFRSTEQAPRPRAIAHPALSFERICDYEIARGYERVAHALLVMRRES